MISTREDRTDQQIMDEVLILARNFPPYNDKGRGGVGYVIRVLKFCKFFPSFGFKPIVVTVTKNPGRKVEPGNDPLLREINEGTLIHYYPESRLVRFVEKVSTRKRKLKRVRRRSLKYWLSYLLFALLSGTVKNLYHVIKKRFLIPDEGVLWNREVTAFVSTLIQKRNVRYLLTISPPNSTHLIGVEVKKKFDITWCADFKDAWVGNPLFRSRSAARNRREEEQEKMVLETADLITTVNAPSLELLRSHADRQGPERFAIIYNGFDTDELDVPAHPYDPGHIHLIHCGVLYRERPLGPFLRVITQMVQQGKPFRVHLLGNVEDPTCREYQGRYPSVVRILGVVSRQQTISMIKGADVTLLVQSDYYFAPLSGKIFEYLACDKKVIGLVPKGVAEEFLRDHQMGWSCDPEDEGRIREILEDVWQEWNEKKLSTRFPDEVKNRFDRKTSTGMMANLLRTQREKQ